MKIIILLLIPSLSFAQANKYADSVKAIEAIMAPYKAAADTFAMYNQLKAYYYQKANPNPILMNEDRRIDSARMIFRKKIKK